MELSNLGQSLTAREIVELVQADLVRVEHEISLQSISSVDAITTIGRYLHASGGKRLRPTLLLLASKLAGNGGESAIRLAAVVEMIHAATLVHDDVIDVAETRRGRPSTNVLFGNHTSVLAGDWLYMQAFQVALRERNFRVLDVLIALTQMMVEGELLQLERLGSISVTEADYMDLVDRKTASLFAACARLGAMVAGAGESVEESLGEYAWNLGVAFQMVDDVLDFTASQRVLGKPVGSDLRQGTYTLPLFYYIEQDGQGRQAAELIKANIDDLIQAIRTSPAIEASKVEARRFVKTAQDALTIFPDNVYRRALWNLADYVIERSL